MEKGICWAEKRVIPTLSVSDNVMKDDNNTTDDYFLSIQNLKAETEYMVRAYFKTQLGITYSDVHYFKTKNKLTKHYDYGVDINGVIWATRNVGAPGEFSSSISDPGMLYQWNRKVGWSATDPLTSVPAGQPWNENSDKITGLLWDDSQDPCPEGWRIPTFNELEQLNNHAGLSLGEYESYNSRWNDIILPYTSMRAYNGESNRNNQGYYWLKRKASNEYDSSIYLFNFARGHWTWSNIPVKSAAFCIRCVKK